MGVKVKVKKIAHMALCRLKAYGSRGVVFNCVTATIEKGYACEIHQGGKVMSVRCRLPYVILHLERMFRSLGAKTERKYYEY